MVMVIGIVGIAINTVGPLRWSSHMSGSWSKTRNLRMSLSMGEVQPRISREMGLKNLDLVSPSPSSVQISSIEQAGVFGLIGLIKASMAEANLGPAVGAVHWESVVGFMMI